MRFSKVWIFDLDNTLHDASPHIFPHINRSMTEYVMRHLGLAEPEASELRRHYWQRYGATLLGLMRHHGIDPTHFLWHTHQFPDLHRMVVREPALRSTLRRLPGRKVVFSNAPVHYSRAVLDVLDIGGFFADVFTIEHTGFQPKPDSRGFLKLLARNRARADRCIMVEDSLDNLRTAKRLGMTTVWVARSSKVPGYVDVAIRNLLELPRLVPRLA